MLRKPAVKRAPIRLLTLAFALTACATRAGDGTPAREYLDQQTGATITIVTAPLVFASARPELAANVRDYATLEAAAVNRSGKVGYVLIAYFWSTVDPRLRGEPPPAPEPLVLQADDRRIRLSAHGHSAHDAGVGDLVEAPPGSNTTPSVYDTDLATLRFIGEARHLGLIVDSGHSTLTYEVWKDGREPLRGFVRHMSGGD